MTELRFGGGVKTIKRETVVNCNRMQNIVIGEGVENIESGAFLFTPREPSYRFSIPASVTNIGARAFGRPQDYSESSNGDMIFSWRIQFDVDPANPAYQADGNKLILKNRHGENAK